MPNLFHAMNGGQEIGLETKMMLDELQSMINSTEKKRLPRPLVFKWIESKNRTPTNFLTTATFHIPIWEDDTHIGLA